MLRRLTPALLGSCSSRSDNTGRTPSLTPSLRTSGPTPTELDAAVAGLTQTYSYFDNQTISDLVVTAPNAPELITQFKNRGSVLDEITQTALQQFITQVMPVNRSIEVRTIPA